MERYPALKIFILFAAGISIGSTIGIPLLLWLGTGLVMTCLALLLRKRPVGVWCLALLVVWSAGGWFQLRTTISRGPWTAGEQVGVVRIESEPQLDRDRWLFRASVQAVATPDGKWRPARFTAAARMPNELGLAPRYGDVLAVAGNWRLAPEARNPGGFDYRNYLEHQEVAGLLRIEQAQLVLRSSGNPLVGAVVIPARQYIRGLVNTWLGGDEAALMLGLLLGERGQLSERVREAFSDTGTTHVLAVSGLHVVLVAFILFLLLRSAQVPKRGAAVGTVAGLVFYTLLTGAPPSIVRATIMSAAVIAGSLFERRGSGLNMLGLSGLLILAFWPQALFDVGFQLSYAATFGILALTRPLQNLLFRAIGQPQAREWLLVPLAVSAAAQLATSPLLAYHFHRIPMISLAANLVVVPLTNFLLALGLTMSMVGTAAKILVAPLAAAAYAVGWLTLRSVELFAACRWATVNWPRPDLLQVLTYGLLLVLLFGWARLGRWRLAAIGACLALANVMVWQRALVSAPQLQAHFLDVGQGDAAVICFANGRRIMIDAGPAGEGYDSGKMAIVPFLRYAGIRKLDQVIISHGDDDHCGGLRYVLEHVPVERLTVAWQPGQRPMYLEALETAARLGVEIDSLSGYDTLDGIWPARSFVYCRPDTVENGNETSVVAFIQYGNASLFFSGDMGPELEGHLARQGLLPHCTVLKVPHHGSRINNGPEIIARLRPELCVIPVGEYNRFGHPSPEVVAGYSNVGTRVIRTDEAGAVTLESNGVRLKVVTMVSH